MKILFVSTTDIAGGAEKNALDLYRSFGRGGHDVKLVVGLKTSDDENVVEIDNDANRNMWSGYWRRRQRAFYKSKQNRQARGAGWMANLGELSRWWQWQLGYEDFSFPGTRKIMLNDTESPDLVHLHNLHGAYFDLRVLAELSRKLPVVVTLHDEWLLTGHCSYTFGCRKWETGCGACPHPDTYPAIKRDATDRNLARKKGIYGQSRLFVTAPSLWLLQQAERSALGAGFAGSRLIPYGIDQDQFRPGDRQRARESLGLPSDGFVFLFLANKARANPFKDFKTLERAIVEIAQKTDREATFLVVGTEAPAERVGSLTVRYIGYQSDVERVAAIYQAADLFLHAARADNFPLTILESLSCGVPVVATDVGGIREQIDDGMNGFLVAPGDSQGIAQRALQLMRDEGLRQRMAVAAFETARGKYSLIRQTSDYQVWYEQVMSDHAMIKRMDSRVVVA